MSAEMNPFGVKDFIDTGRGCAAIYRLSRLEEMGLGNISHFPYSIKLLLEALLRHVDGRFVTEEDVESLARWNPKKMPERETLFIPARVLLQDFTGSSRDWAAKGTCLLGVSAVIAESYERIHRSNLLGMGVLPLQFKKGENADSLGIKGDEVLNILGISNIEPRRELHVVARGENGKEKTFNVNIGFGQILVSNGGWMTEINIGIHYS